MLVIAILTLGLLAALNYHLGGKSLFHPAVVFCGIWAFDLSVIFAVGDFFFPLSPETLLIFTFGGLVFSVGAHAAKAIRSRPKNACESTKFATWLLWMIVFLFPLFLRWIFQVAEERADSPLLMALRLGLVDMEGESLALTIFGNLTLLSSIVVLIAYREKTGHEKRAWIAFILSMTMAILTGTKGAPLWIVVGLVYIDWLNTQRIRWKAVAIVCVLIVGIFVLVEYTVHINGDSLEDSSQQLVNNAALYVSGGIVAVDRVVRDPHIVPLANPAYDIIMRILKRVGYHTKVVSAHGYQFVDIGPNSLINNTYSIYGSWVNLGSFGMVTAMALIGFMCGLAYHRALLGGKVSAIFYAVLFPAVFFSPFSDLTTTFIWLLLVLLVSWVVYYFPLRLARFKGLLSEIVRADMAKLEPYK